MSFGNQSLDGFLQARTAASEILFREGLRQEPAEIGFEEALLMQAASNLLVQRDTFYGVEVTNLSQRRSGVVYPILRKFENTYGITVGAMEDASIAHSQRRPPRRFYQATTLGMTVFGLFVPTESITLEQD